MTSQNLPPAADVLAEAYAIVRTPCSAAETQRATLLFEIARELRCAADMRELRARGAGADAEVAKRKLRAAGIMPGQLVPDLATGGTLPAVRLLRDRAPEMHWPEPASEAVEMPEGAAPKTERYVDDATWGAALRARGGLEGLAETVVAVDPSVTQRMPIVWQVGDKADCRHCHTPIECVEVSTKVDVSASKYDQRVSWRHRYTGQVACAVPATAGGIEGSEPTHTFAEPDR